MEIKIDRLKADLLLNGIKKDAGPVIVSSINKAMTQTKKESATTIMEHVNLQKRVITSGPSGKRKTFKTIKANITNLQGVLRTIGANIPLLHYRSPHWSITRAPKKINVQVSKRKAKTQLKYAFLAHMKSGHIGLFQRQSKSRLPIKELYGPGVADAIGQVTEIKEKVNVIAVNSMENNLTAEVDKCLVKY